MKKLKPILFAILILILLLFIIGGMLELLPQPLFVLSSQTILVILVCGGALIIGLLLKFFRREVRFLGVSMLPFFNQKELVVCSNQSQYQKYTSLLEKAGITYRTKARDLSARFVQTIIRKKNPRRRKKIVTRFFCQSLAAISCGTHSALASARTKPT